MKANYIWITIIANVYFVFLRARLFWLFCMCLFPHVLMYLDEITERYFGHWHSLGSSIWCLENLGFGWRQWSLFSFIGCWVNFFCFLSLIIIVSHLFSLYTRVLFPSCVTCSLQSLFFYRERSQKMWRNWNIAKSVCGLFFLTESSLFTT